MLFSESNIWLRVVLAVLATWRVTHLLSREDGPVDLLVRFRRRLGNGVAGALLDCFYCLSLWVAAVFTFFVTRDPTGWWVAWLAISGGACLLERTGQDAVVIRQLPEVEGNAHELLRSEAAESGNFNGAESHGGPGRGASSAHPSP